MTYVPQPGTFPYRVIDFLREHGEGAELPAAEICDALDINLDGFASCMAAARRHGVLRARQCPENPKRLLWSLGDGTPLAAPPQDEETLRGDTPEPRRTPGVTTGLDAALRSSGFSGPAVVGETASRPPAEKHRRRHHKTAATAPISAPIQFRVGAFSDGSMVIQSSTGPVELSPADAAHLVAFVQSHYHQVQQ
jgi:hypothetical protein